MMRVMITAMAVFGVSVGALWADLRIIDGDTLELAGERYRIAGIDAPEAGQRCLDAKGISWDCGDAATRALDALTSGKRVRCHGEGQDLYGRIIARCTANGRDIGGDMVASGMAWAFKKFSDAYVVDEFKAKSAGRGIWQGPAQPAWALREEAWKIAGRLAPEGCPIKGNISARGKIYHMPWSSAYRKTKIDPARGERWFCDEAAAQKAGWRAPRSR